MTGILSSLFCYLIEEGGLEVMWSSEQVWDKDMMWARFKPANSLELSYYPFSKWRRRDTYRLSHTCEIWIRCPGWLCVWTTGNIGLGFMLFFLASNIMLFFISAGYSITVLSPCFLWCWTLQETKRESELCSVESITFKVYVHTGAIQACGAPVDAYTDSNFYGLRRPGYNH